MAELADRLGKEVNIDECEVEWEWVQTTGGDSSKKIVYHYWGEVIRTQAGFSAQPPNFDLKIENLDFWSKNHNNDVAVDFKCHVRTDESSINGAEVQGVYNIFTLRQMKQPEKVVIVGAVEDYKYGVSSGDNNRNDVKTGNIRNDVKTDVHNGNDVTVGVIRLPVDVKIKLECRIYGAMPSSLVVFKLVHNHQIEHEIREESIRGDAASSLKSSSSSSSKSSSSSSSLIKDGALEARRRRGENFEFLSLDYTPDLAKDANKSFICAAFNPRMLRAVSSSSSSSTSSSFPIPITIARLDILHPPSAPKLTFSGGRVYKGAYWVPISGTIGVECSSDLAGNPVGKRRLVSQIPDLRNDRIVAAGRLLRYYNFNTESRKSFRFECSLRTDPAISEEIFRIEKTVNVAFGPTFLSIETIHDKRNGKAVLMAGREAIFICASLKSFPSAVVDWKMPLGRRCKTSPPEPDPNRCYFTPEREDFGRSVSCSATNPISNKTIEHKMVFNTLHYDVSAECGIEKDEFGLQQVSCTVDRYPKVSLSDVEKMIYVKYAPSEAGSHVNESLTILQDAMDVHQKYQSRYPHPANLFRFRYSFYYFSQSKGILTISDSSSQSSSSGEFVTVTFGLSINERYSTRDLASVQLRVRRKPHLVCGREGCSKRKRPSSAMEPVIDSSSSHSSNDANMTIVYALFSVVIAAIIVIFLVILGKQNHRGKTGNSRNSSDENVGFEDGRSQCELPQHARNMRRCYADSQYSFHSGYTPRHSPGQISVISTPTRASAIDLAGLPTPNSRTFPFNFPQHLYSNSHRNFEDIQFDRKLLDIKETIGQGEYGQVFLASAFSVSEIGEWTDVAVKSVKAEADKSAKDALLAEMSIMRLVEPHDNVVRLLGCCIDADPYYVILEYLPGGNLQDFLRRMGASSSSQRAIPLNSSDLVDYGYQVAVGMNHLASSTVVHRDLAARNILLSSDCRNVKIADFGLARDVLGFGVYEQRSETRLPIRWMAHEFLFKGSSSSMSDVWSFGVLLWEIATLGATPYGHSPSEAVMRSVKAGERLKRPTHCSVAFFTQVEECWLEVPEDRPNFSRLADEMRRFATEEDAIDMKNFSPDLYQKLSSNVMADEKF